MTLEGERLAQRAREFGKETRRRQERFEDRQLQIKLGKQRHKDAERLARAAERGEYGDAPSRRSGRGLIKLLLLVVFIAALFTYWDDFKKGFSEATKSATPSPKAVGATDPQAQPTSEIVEPAPHRQILQTKQSYYPPCSATVTDHCRETP